MALGTYGPGEHRAAFGEFTRDASALPPVQSHHQWAIILKIPPSQFVFASRTLAARILHAAVGLTTVWCLGCCAFEPLLGSVLGSEQSMVARCSADDDTSGPTVAASSGDYTATVSAVASGSDPVQALACVCLSCFAPVPAASNVAVIAAPVPRQPSVEPTTPASVDRKPLVPPPQTAL